jgi:hypothetical protein
MGAIAKESLEAALNKTLESIKATHGSVSEDTITAYYEANNLGSTKLSKMLKYYRSKSS